MEIFAVQIFKSFILKIVKLIDLLFHDSDLYIMLRRLSHIKIVQKFLLFFPNNFVVFRFYI